jgi:hypothetical protein
VDDFDGDSGVFRLVIDEPEIQIVNLSNKRFVLVVEDPTDDRWSNGKNPAQPL